MVNYILILLIGIIWGGQFVLIDVALLDYAPKQLALLRTFFAAIFLILFCSFTRRKKNKRSFFAWLKIIAISIFEVVIPFTLIMWGQQFISGSMTSILIGTIPLFTIILVLLTRIEQATFTKFIGILVGFVGLFVLFLPDLIKGSIFSGGILPQITILLGALSFAIALIIIRTLPHENSFLLSKDTFIIGALIMLVINLIDGSFIEMDFYLQSSSFFAAIVLGALCSGFVYVLYVTLIKQAGAGFCSLSNYLVPFFGSVFGVIIMKDHISINMIFACILILSSITIEPIFNQLKKVA